MKNYEVTIKHSGNKYFTCVVKGKKGYYRKAITIMETAFINMPEINEWWCDGTTQEKEGEIILM